MTSRRVVVTGIGAITPFGVGHDAYWDGLACGRSAAALITGFDVDGLPTRFAAMVPVSETELDGLVRNSKSTKTMSRAIKFAVIAADEAIADAGFGVFEMNSYRCGTAMGCGGLGLCDIDHSLNTIRVIANSVSPDGSIDPNMVWRNTIGEINPITPLRALPNMTAAHIAINHHAQGPCLTIATACTSSAQAVGEAFRQIQSGRADVMICGGTDSMINPPGLLAFTALGVLSRNNEEYTTAARPFDRRRDGFLLGEGAAVLILEEYEFCRRRGGRPYAEVLGYASTCDAYRLTDEPPDARGSVEAMKEALNDGGTHPEQVDYINAHGTGTRMNDKAETLAIKKVFGPSAPPVSSTKSMIGHLVAAAGAVEFTACLLAMKHQRIPPTINYAEPDPECDLDYVPNCPRQSRLDVVVSNSFGFGGQNACLVARRLA
jgi:3-oxoacyl-[acyl-carrier-protein] synthase II